VTHICITCNDTTPIYTALATERKGSVHKILVHIEGKTGGPKRIQVGMSVSMRATAGLILSRVPSQFPTIKCKKFTEKNSVLHCVGFYQVHPPVELQSAVAY
jgi:hypothetical protein